MSQSGVLCSSQYWLDPLQVFIVADVRLHERAKGSVQLVDIEVGYLSQLPPLPQSLY